MISFSQKSFVLKMVRYLVSGGIAALVDLGSLYVLTDIVHMWYLASATIAFILTLITSFLLQRFWTFSNAQGASHKQFGSYLMLSIVNIFVNTGLMYLFVTIFGIPYLFAQVGVIAIIAFYGFFLYQYWIFKEREPVAPLEHTS